MIDYIAQNWQNILALTVEHIRMTFMAVGISILIGVPLGILISYVKKLGKPVLGLANVVQAVPSIALLGLAIPLLGIGTLPAVVMVVIYSLLPIIKNTYIGLENIDPLTLEAARGIGLTRMQRLFRIRLPLALPVIMAGVRVSAVTAVGLMTMAAFIGAGGLGSLIFSGIRTVSNVQILAGAVPACILAILVDWLLGVVEKAVTPLSLQKEYKEKGEKWKKEKRRKRITAAVAVVLIAALLSADAFSGMNAQTEDSIVIASKDHTEQIVLMNLYADIIENDTDISVERKENLGGTQVCLGAMTKGEIDMYIDYTGTQYMSILKHDTSNDTEKVYSTCKKEMKEKYDIELLDETAFNNTYVLAMRKDQADELGISKVSDLAGVADKLDAGTTIEFKSRKDGYDALCSFYGLNFRSYRGIDGSPRYTALANEQIDVIDAFSTDGLLAKFDLALLEDDRNFFPPYHAVPSVRSEVLEKYPEIEDACDRLSEKLTEEAMQYMNNQVDEKGMDPADVAHSWLLDQGLIEE